MRGREEGRDWEPAAFATQKLACFYIKNNLFYNAFFMMLNIAGLQKNIKDEGRCQFFRTFHCCGFTLAAFEISLVESHVVLRQKLPFRIRSSTLQFLSS